MSHDEHRNAGFLSFAETKIREVQNPPIVQISPKRAIHASFCRK